jgi:hypothetical protein
MKMPNGRKFHQTSVAERLAAIRQLTDFMEGAETARGSMARKYSLRARQDGCPAAVPGIDVTSLHAKIRKLTLHPSTCLRPGRFLGKSAHRNGFAAHEAMTGRSTELTLFNGDDSVENTNVCSKIIYRYCGRPRPIARLDGVSASNSPSATAIAASLVLDEQFILERMCSTCVDAVRVDTKSCLAICGFEAPPAMRCNT